MIGVLVGRPDAGGFAAEKRILSKVWNKLAYTHIRMQNNLPVASERMC